MSSFIVSNSHLNVLADAVALAGLLPPDVTPLKVMQALRTINLSVVSQHTAYLPPDKRWAVPQSLDDHDYPFLPGKFTAAINNGAINSDDLAGMIVCFENQCGDLNVYPLVVQMLNGLREAYPATSDEAIMAGIHHLSNCDALAFCAPLASSLP